ncbi:C-type cyclin [Trichophyton equinum CBS 127.97]|uniref:RNA polymerase II holoenzyme cyclin-like subunit n=1 Tax=Trichophyton equinum (strain ATCC MYA-4606 / CBS 127.97) TaxID=559882 RepID=F2PV29_TRIEC|nr:C-type cyclin [Trichophyton equinum CBS 127.97]
MAANYWTSTQRRFWLFDREQLAETRAALDEADRAFIAQYPLPDHRLVNIYINQQLIKLGKRMNTRQQALATAQVYVKRFFTKVSIRRTNPYLLLTTAFYLACKTEECPQHIKYVVSEARGLWPEFILSDSAKVGECEFWLISELNSQLIVHHPYRTLSDFSSTLTNTASSGLTLSSDEIALAWSVVNDSYLTDLPLLQPPHVIAVMAVFVAVVFKPGTSSSSSSASTGAAAAAAAAAAGPGTLASASTSTGTGTGSRNRHDKVLPGWRRAYEEGMGDGGRVQKVVEWLAGSEVSI